MLRFLLRGCKMLNQHKGLERLEHRVLQVREINNNLCRLERRTMFVPLSSCCCSQATSVGLLYFLLPTCFIDLKQGCNCNSIRDGTTGSDFLHRSCTLLAFSSYQWLKPSFCHALTNRLRPLSLSLNRVQLQRGKTCLNRRVSFETSQLFTWMWLTSSYLLSTFTSLSHISSSQQTVWGVNNNPQVHNLKHCRSVHKVNSIEHS